MHAVHCLIICSSARMNRAMLIGSLSYIDGDSYEIVVNLWCFKLSDTYSISFNLSNVGEFF